MEDRGEAISVELDAARAAEVADQAQRLGLRSVTVVEADAAGRCRSARAASTGSWSTRPARTSAPSPRGRTPAGASRRARSSGWSRSRTGSCAARRGTLRPGGVLVYSTCTISRRENEDRVAALLAASARRRGCRALAVEDLGERAPGLASPLDSRFLQLRPDRDRTTGFFICRLKRDDGVTDERRAGDERERAASGPPARAAASRGCARRSSRAASAACTVCAASSWSRSAPTAANTRRSRG